MSKQIGARTREKWVDDVKVIACILVVVGHFFQSMVKASILPDSGLYEWFITTVYYFHVPLFFICSGYLYQKYSKVNSVGSWRRNVAKKVLALGIPYVTFSTATWVLKRHFRAVLTIKLVDWETPCYFILLRHTGICTHCSLFSFLHQLLRV